MATVTQDKYSPWPRVCDICGQLRSINTMRKLDAKTYVCDKHPGERTAIMLDTLNAHARPPQTWPNKDAKPQNPEYPNTLEADEGALFAFIDRQIQAAARFETIQSGQAAAPSFGGILLTMGWSARYLYDLIVQGTRTTLLVRARALLAQIATYLLTRQRGTKTGLAPTSTRATDAFFGAFLEPSATSYTTQDQAACGLAMLYAHRLLATQGYIDSARASASYLRNVQAIGKNGTHYTSSDSAGTARLYTGGVASKVSSASGFYSNHAFYPMDLLTLEFWKALETTDGDQSLGATAVVTGFDTAPSQLLSTSMTDMRTFWDNGVMDAAGEKYTGLSETTPREFFNAYPASKLNFSLIGTGRWEFQDGNASTGTMITAQNFAGALGSLYAYEGVSARVSTVSDWLRTFTSNEDFETPDNTSPSVLARSTTGTYDPTSSLTTLLLVRDADDSYAPIALNGSSLYDWGAFGVLSPLWFARYQTSFKESRLLALGTTRRLDDGVPTDGLFYDRIELRGLSGLTFQTMFAIDMTDPNGTTASASSNGATIVTSPPSTGLIFWVKGDSGITPSSDGLRMLTWDNQAVSPNPGLISQGADGFYGPLINLDSIDGIPATTWTTTMATDMDVLLGTSAGGVHLKDRNGTDIGYGVGETSTITWMAIVVARVAADFGGILGGTLFRLGNTAGGGQLDLELIFRIFVADLPPVGTQSLTLFSNDWTDDYVTALYGPATPAATYRDIPLLLHYEASGRSGNHIYVTSPTIGTKVEIALTPTTLPSVSAHVHQQSSYGTVDVIASHFDRWIGLRSEDICWDHLLSPSEQATAYGYFGGRYPSFGIAETPLAMVNDAVRAAQYGSSFRMAH